ncbi:MAG: hypothetical protein M0Z33_01010 [Actinomycetota bacterium]|nr:hypothetical protein [Actinomycetota bacterium]
MIVRVLEEGQYELGDEESERLEKLDGALDEAIRAGDEDAFSRALDAVIAEVRSAGRALGPASIVPSDVAVPAPGTTLAEVRRLLGDGSAPSQDGSDQ